MTSFFDCCVSRVFLLDIKSVFSQKENTHTHKSPEQRKVLKLRASLIFVVRDFKEGGGAKTTKRWCVLFVCTERYTHRGDTHTQIARDSER